MEKILEKKKILSILITLIELVIFSYLFLNQRIIKMENISVIISIILIIINSVFFVFKSLQKRIVNKKQLIFLLIINLIIGFFICGKPLFLMDYFLSIEIKNIIKYFIVCIFIFPFILNLLTLIDMVDIIKVTPKYIKDKKSLWFCLIIFLIFFVPWIIAGISFYPGNMSSDSVSQITQAYGWYQIDNAHPAFNTIVIRWLFKIWDCPFMIVIAYQLYLSIICTYIYKYLYKRNVSSKFLYASAIILSLSCNNISLLTMIWKDVPYTISLLWLTFELYKLAKEQDKYMRKISNIIKLIIALVLTYVSRHNGIFPYYITIAYMMLLFFKSKCRKRIIFTIVTSVVLIWGIRHPLFNYYNVNRSNIMTSGSASFAAKGLGALIYYDVELTENDKKDINKMVKLEYLSKYYNPYSIDTYSFNKEVKWDEGIEKVGVKKIYLMYIKHFFKNPRAIIRDRLDSCNLVWSMDTPNDGFNYKYDYGIAYASYIKDIKNFKKGENNRYMPKDSIGNKLIKQYQDTINEIKILDILCWRPAFMISIMILLIFYGIIKKVKIIPGMLPTIISILFWIMLMGHQDYRYVWFIFIDVYILGILLLTDKSSC